ARRKQLVSRHCAGASAWPQPRLARPRRGRREFGFLIFARRIGGRDRGCDRHTRHAQCDPTTDAVRWWSVTESLLLCLVAWVRWLFVVVTPRRDGALPDKRRG